MSLSKIDTLGNHSPTYIEKGICEYNCFKLNHVTKVKYLGIYFDEYVKYKIQIEIIINRLKKLYYVFKELNQILNLYT